MKYILMAFINHYDWVNSSMLRFLLKTLLIITLGLLPVANTALAQEIDTSGFKRVIREVVDFSGDTLEVADYDSTLFLKEADFREARFDSRANFGDAHFASDADFGDAHFASDADFPFARFASWANFGYAHFASRANFVDAHFDLRPYFGFAHFDSLANFVDARFDSTADFGDAHFDSLANFGYARFVSWADFGDAHFDSLANFGYARFDSLADFGGVEFSSEFILDGCLLPDILFFNDVKTEQEIDFTYTRTDTIPGSKKRCVIDLYKTDISKIKLDYSRFRILRDTSRYQRRQLSNIYEQVLKMQKVQGFIDGYEVADKEYQEFQLTYNRENPYLAKWFGVTFSWGHIINWLQKYWWDYGYAQEYIFFWIFGALSIFTMINAFLFRTLNEHVYKIKNIYPYRYFPPPGSNYKRSKVPDTGQPVSPAVAGLEMPTGKVLIMSFFYTSLIFFGLKMSVDRINFDRWGYALLLIFEYSFGLICLAYLVNFIIN